MSTPDSAEVTDSAGTTGDSTTRTLALPAASDSPPEVEERESEGSSIVFTATLVLLVGLALFGRRIFNGLFTDDGVRTWATMFVGVTVQALPFLV
ncbi:permease, partial [Kribbella sp. NPDC026596]